MALACNILWVTANTLIKLSVLHFYVSIFITVAMARTALIVGLLSLGYWIAFVLSTALVYQPETCSWDRNIKDDACASSYKYYLASSILNTILDIVIVALPLPCLWGLQMKLSKKIALSVILSLGVM